MKLAVKVGTFVFLVLAGLIFLVYSFISGGSDSAKTLPKVNVVSSFALIDQDGKMFGDEDLRGKVWVVDFIFTRCKGPCPLMTEKMAELQREFKGDERVHFVTITMDARFDSPKVMKEFAEERGADFSTWHFLTGNAEEILSIARNIFKVPADRDPEMHTTRFVLIDKEGFIRSYHDSLEPESFGSLKSHLHSLKKK